MIHKIIKQYKAATIQTKIFWIVVLSVGLLTALMCFYPYLWMYQHRSPRQITPTELKK